MGGVEQNTAVRVRVRLVMARRPMRLGDMVRYNECLLGLMLPCLLINSSRELVMYSPPLSLIMLLIFNESFKFLEGR